MSDGVSSPALVKPKVLVPQQQILKGKKIPKFQVKSVQSDAPLLFHAFVLAGLAGAPVTEGGHARWILQGLA